MTFPTVKFDYFDSKEMSNPSGQILSRGSFAFVRELGSGINSGLLFRDIKIPTDLTADTFPSTVEAIVFYNLTPGTIISNMRLWNNNHSALHRDLVRLQFAASGVWQPNAIWPSGIHNELSKQVPSSANVFRMDGSSSLMAVNEENVSQFIYLNAVVNKLHPPGRFGLGVNGEIRITMIFDYYS